MKVKLVLLDSNKEYLNRLMSTLSQKYSDKLEVYSFTDMSLVFDIFNTVKADVFLANEEFDVDVNNLPKDCGFAYIAEDSAAESIKSSRAVAKYQRVDLFYKEVLGIYAEKSSNITAYKSNSNSMTQLVAFTSASGGAGSSLLSVAFSKYAASCGKRVLYISLELLGNTDDYFKGEGRLDFGDVIFAIKSRKVNLSLKLESIVRQDVSGVYFYSSSDVFLDLLELDEEDISVLFKELCDGGLYDYIVIDTDCSFDERFKAVMELCHKVILINDDKTVSDSKLKMFYDSIKLLESQSKSDILNKMYLVHNKSDISSFKASEELDIKCIGSVPAFTGKTIEEIVSQMVSAELLKELICTC